MKDAVYNLMKGGVLGVAMIIPGVSGGTMALVMGIYERMLMAINRITPTALKEFLPPFPEGPLVKWRAACVRLDLIFLGLLSMGAVIVFGALTKVMPHMMQNHHEPTFGFFLGLILASVIIPFKLIKKTTWKVILAIAIGTAATSYLGHRDNQRQHERIVSYQTMKNEDTQKNNAAEINISAGHLGYIFVSMGVAISACILPGVSGSLVLVIFGVYSEILESIRNLGKAVLSFDFKSIVLADLLIVSTASLGAIIGLIAFARFMKFALKRFHDTTMGCLIGLMLGSLYVIWPFRESGIISISNSGKEKYAFGFPQVPEMGTTLWLTIGAAVAGIAIIVVMEALDRKKQKPASDLADSIN